MGYIPSSRYYICSSLSRYYARSLTPNVIAMKRSMCLADDKIAAPGVYLVRVAVHLELIRASVSDVVSIKAIPTCVSGRKGNPHTRYVYYYLVECTSSPADTLLFYIQ